MIKTKLSMSMVFLNEFVIQEKIPPSRFINIQYVDGQYILFYWIEGNR